MQRSFGQGKNFECSKQVLGSQQARIAASRFAAVLTVFAAMAGHLALAYLNAF